MLSLQQHRSHPRLSEQCGALQRNDWCLQRTQSTRRSPVVCSAVHKLQDEEVHKVPAAIRRGAVAIAATAWLSAMPLPASADLPMVSPSDVTAAAKPLAKQPVQKGKVWLLLAGGSAALFATTVALERSRLFPAIAKANEAMSISKAAREGAAVAEQQQQPLDVQPESSSWGDETASTDAVLQGLQSASSRVLDKKGAAEADKPEGSTSSNAPSQTTVTATKDDGDASSNVRLPDTATADRIDGDASNNASPQGKVSSQQSGSESVSTADSPTSTALPPSVDQNMQASTSVSDSASERSAAVAAKQEAGKSRVDLQSAVPPASNTDRKPPPDAPEAESSSHAAAAAPTESLRRDAVALSSNEAEAGKAAPVVELPSQAAAIPPLSEMSSDDLERLIAAKKQQQQQLEKDAAKARSREEQHKEPSRDLADLSEEELQSLIATKRKMAANVVKTVVDP